MYKNVLRPSLALLILPFLSGCLQDTASYTLGARDHALTLVRNQTWPFQSTLDLSVMISRMPDCNGGGDIKGLPEDSEFVLYRAPDEYPEPLLMLKAGNRVFAISDQSCRMQEFKEMPDNLGEKLGVFTAKEGTFQFVAGGA